MVLCCYYSIARLCGVSGASLWLEWQRLNNFLKTNRGHGFERFYALLSTPICSLAMMLRWTRCYSRAGNMSCEFHAVTSSFTTFILQYSHDHTTMGAMCQSAAFPTPYHTPKVLVRCMLVQGQVWHDSKM